MADQTPERPDFLEAYRAIVVPEPILSQDASDETVRATTDAYFREVIDSLDLSPRTLEAFFEISWKTLTPLYESYIPDSERVRATDDLFYSFRRRGHQALASVTYIRDDFNYQIAHYAKYPLLDSTEAMIRDYQRLERIEFGLE